MSWLVDDDPDRDFEHRVRERPHPKGSRPRTKIRPNVESAPEGRVLAVDRGRFRVLVNEGTEDEHEVNATAARELGRGAVVTGERVRIVGDLSGAHGSLARIVATLPREHVLRRSADDTDRVERIIVANADQMLIVAAAASPEPRLRLIDRYLVAARDAGMEPLLVVTKTDLADPAAFIAMLSDMDIPTFLSSPDHIPAEAIRAALIGHTTVLVGHSGVGKSTLVNALVPGSQRETGAVNEVTGRGRHTSSSSRSIRIETATGTGYVIDTPGIRSFGLGHVKPEGILASFDELAQLAASCPRGCSHARNAPDCFIDEAVTHTADPNLAARLAARLTSYRRLMAALRPSPTGP